MDQTRSDQHPASVLWQWYKDMGVDEVTAQQPTNWFEASPTPKIQPQIRDIAEVAKERAAIVTSHTTSPVRAAQVASASLTETIAQARKAADSADSLDKLKKITAEFDGCRFKKTAKNMVFADGNADSDIMVIADAPDADEDRQGVSFCGESGQLLDKMLSSINLSRTDDCYISHCMFWRPPGNQPPTAEDISICLPLVEKHIALFNPKIIIVAGGTAAKALLNTTESMTRIRGKEYSYNNQYLQKDIPVRVLFHPSYLIEQPLHKRLAWQDLLNLKQFLVENDIKLSR